MSSSLPIANNEFNSSIRATTTTNDHHRHFKMYKPAKVLTQFKFTHRKRRNRILLGDVIAVANITTATGCTSLPSPSLPGLMAIGRLDEASEGLLLLTTDGKVSEQVRRKSVEKEYYVELNGQITQVAIDQLRNGVRISLPTTLANNKKQKQCHHADGDNNDGCWESSSSPLPSNNAYTTLPCKARILDTSIIAVEKRSSVATSVKEGEPHLPDEETEPKRQKRRKRKKKKFGGTCNKCKQTGHKARDCSENPVDYETSSNGCASTSDDTTNGNGNDIIEMALPLGIPPPSPHPSRDKSRRNNHPTSWISITINEGKNRQVRRMTAAVGYPTLRLVRVRIGSVRLDGMVAGEVKELDDDIMIGFNDYITRTIELIDG